MIDCPNGDIRDLLPDYVHGSLTEDVHLEIESHVTSCVACTEELALLRRIQEALAPAHTVDVAAIVAALPAQPARRPRLVKDENTARTPSRRPFFEQRWLRYAAAVVLVVGAGSLVASRTGLVTLGPPAAGASVTNDTPGFAVAAIASDLDDAELRGLLDEIDGLESRPAAESEGIVRGIPELAVETEG